MLGLPLLPYLISDQVPPSRALSPTSLPLSKSSPQFPPSVGTQPRTRFVILSCPPAPSKPFLSVPPIFPLYSQSLTPPPVAFLGPFFVPQHPAYKAHMYFSYINFTFVCIYCRLPAAHLVPPPPPSNTLLPFSLKPLWSGFCPLSRLCSMPRLFFPTPPKPPLFHVLDLVPPTFLVLSPPTMGSKLTHLPTTSSLP